MSSAGSPDLTLFQPSWVAAGAVSVASRFVPLPFIDDFLKERSERYVVARVLEAAGFEYPVTEVSPLYDEDYGSSLVGRVVKQGIMRGLLFPVRRVVRIARAVTGVPRDAVRPPLLGRAVALSIERGLLAPTQLVEERLDDAVRIRDAFGHAMKGTNRGLIKGAAGDLRRIATRGGDTSQAEASVARLATDFDKRFEEQLELVFGRRAPKTATSARTDVVPQAS